MAQLAEGWPRDATGSTSASEVGGAAMNPFGAPGVGNYTTDGSSGGSAAALSAGLAVVGTGSDTGGSIQGPASANNVVGIRSPLGAIPEEGELPSFYKQDAPGPMARRARDAVLMFDVLAKTNYYPSVSKKRNLAGQKLCYFNIFEPVPQPPPAPLPPNFIVDPEALALTNRAIEILRAAGATVERVIPTDPMAALMFLQTQVMPRFLGMSAARTTCLTACEAWSWDTYFADPTRFGPGSPVRSAKDIAASPLLHPDFKARLNEAINNPGGLSYEAYCKQKCDVEAKYDEQRTELQSALRALLASGGNCSAFISPTWSFFPFNQSQAGITPLEFGPTVMGPYAGWPSVVVPMGFSTPTAAAPKGLPLGLDIIGPPERFRGMLEVAVVFQDRLTLVTNPPGTPLTKADPRQYNVHFCSP
ncbi:hypothetical protein HXX76_005216 [Chlamydomonas incerta]|uniref:Amidase domain-containing protein n=1 Tax=Chlamydomonas incerta TaxID=51695 RepID=A0A835T4G1_CHLIN|nr:hypothetical protein HXX76_005216 [Chlamydomonas incerta]|eukprot:KAG2438669.1 hypothetical protein HXX76_005216 [Chlamydomonas incerta]